MKLCIYVFCCAYQSETDLNALTSTEQHEWIHTLEDRSGSGIFESSDLVPLWCSCFHSYFPARLMMTNAIELYHRLSLVFCMPSRMISSVLFADIFDWCRVCFTTLTLLYAWDFAFVINHDIIRLCKYDWVLGRRSCIVSVKLLAHHVLRRLFMLLIDELAYSIVLIKR